MYNVLAALWPEGVMALRRRTSIYGLNSAVFSFFLICFMLFFSFPPIQSCKVTNISVEVKLLIYLKTPLSNVYVMRIIIWQYFISLSGDIVHKTVKVSSRVALCHGSSMLLWHTVQSCKVLHWICAHGSFQELSLRRSNNQKLTWAAGICTARRRSCWANARWLVPAPLHRPARGLAGV